jgi:DNA-directed RNA polymerase subunit RPC12/RpoP
VDRVYEYACATCFATFKVQGARDRQESLSTCHPCSLDVMVPGVSIENMMQESMNMKLGAAAGDHLKNHRES